MRTREEIEEELEGAQANFNYLEILMEDLKQELENLEEEEEEE